MPWNTLAFPPPQGAGGRPSLGDRPPPPPEVETVMRYGGRFQGGEGTCLLRHCFVGQSQHWITLILDSKSVLEHHLVTGLCWRT